MIAQEDIFLLMILFLMLVTMPITGTWFIAITDKFEDYIRKHAELED